MKQTAVILVLLIGLCASFMVDAWHPGSGNCDNHDCHCSQGQTASCYHGKCHCSGSSQTSLQSHVCQQSSECHGCQNHQHPYCFNHHCTCVDCNYNHDCHCSQGQTASCYHGKCHCSDNSHTTAPSSSSNHCVHSSDCIDCPGYLVPHCFNFRCACTEHPTLPTKYCNQNTDCSSCYEHHVGFCSDYKCTCTGSIHCIVGNCDHFGCPSGSNPECEVVNGHHRCTCKPSTSATISHCSDNSDCIICSDYQIGQCIHNQCNCSAGMPCIYNNDCHGYGCGSNLHPQCANLDGHSRCLCEASSPFARHECEQSSNCTKCSDYQVGQCNNNQCTCSARMSCIYNNDCHGYGCGSSLYPQCANLDGQSRCLCEASSPSTRHECEQDSDCTKCHEYQVGQCNHNQCTCSAGMSCSYNNDCHGYGCGSSLYPQCAKLDGHSRCLCEATTPSNRHECNGSSDCTKCPVYQVRQCTLNQCTCSAERTCVYNIDCHEYGCGSNWFSVCANLDGQPRCLCEPLSPISRHECEKSSDCTKCSDDKIGQCKHNQCTCSANTTTTKTTVFTTSAPSFTTTQRKLSTSIKSTTAGNTLPSTQVKPDASSTISVISTSLLSTKKATTTNQGKSTTSVLTTMPTTAHTDTMKTTSSYQSTKSLACQNNTECAGYLCPSNKHSYCKMEKDSSICDCTVCVEHNHCFCPVGLVGKCHLDSSNQSHRCVCEIITETSTSASSTTPASPDTTVALRKCHSCGDANSSVSCDTRTIYLGNLQSCKSDEDFCMTDIVHDGSPYPKTYKSCVTEEECRNKWLHQTSDLEYCINYGNVPMTGQYSCHFCCVTDGCNAGQVPDKSTFYSKA